MNLSNLNVAFFICCCITVCLSVTVRVNFEKCDLKGWTCKNSAEISGKHDIVYKCQPNTTTQEIQLWLWQFSAPATITSLTIEDCEKVELSFICSNENKPIQWLKLRNIKNLEIMPVPLVHNPPAIHFENVTMNKIPRDAFVQIKKTVYKPGCFIPLNDLNSISFKNVKINTIETESFKNLSEMRKFEMENVEINRIEYGAIKLTFDPELVASVKNSNLNVLEPLALQVTGDGLSVSNTHIGDMFGSSINGTIYDFEFLNNTVNKIQAGALAILAKKVYINNNFFKEIESGAFKKITPGLLHDSNRSFGTLYFVYDFNNNLIEHVEDGGVRPDITSYKNVATHMNYTENTLQCSCEAVSWLGAEVDLGFGYSVLKDFNTMILDPANKNVCNFNPCMCFGVRSPNKKRDGVAADVTIDFWIWNFAPELDVATLTITNCHTLRLRFGCARHHLKKIQVLHVQHIKILSIYQDQVICNPTSIIFEYIDFLETLPRNTFSQLQTCSRSNCTLNQLVFENVKIGTIESNAIELINDLKLFRITNVVVENVKAGGIKIINNNDASIYILNSVIDSLDTLAMQIHANRLTIAESTFNLMSYSSINATLHTFEFSSNSVMSLRTAAFNIQSDSVIILKNHFYHIKTGAFQEIYAMDDSKFTYTFVDNFIEDADIASLHPMVSSSSNANIVFVNNKFMCTCDTYFWLEGEIPFGRGLKYSKTFYQDVLDVNNNNTCVFKSCILPLKASKQLRTTSEEECNMSTIEDDFCENYIDENVSTRLIQIVWLNVLCYLFIVYF
ncbi:hypothetical protein FQR65_LT07237 [Abscondita terminalis]|nr:hypothetical protein FQR65_LT07237 [Abscondita terminalis]